MKEYMKYALIFIIPAVVVAFVVLAVLAGWAFGSWVSSTLGVVWVGGVAGTVIFVLWIVVGMLTAGNIVGEAKRNRK